MPADQGEIRAVIQEGIEIIELASPEKIIHENGKVKGLVCSRMELIGFDNKGRPKPVKVDGSEFEIECDTIIPAIGQITDIDFVSSELLTADTGSYLTKIGNAFIGGDALRGASTAINAIGDGRKAAEQIIKESEIDYINPKTEIRGKKTKKELLISRSIRKFAFTHSELPFEKRPGFRLVSQTPDEQSILKEAGRCLYCDEICNICTTVCPNFANYSFDIEPVKFHLEKAVALENGEVEIVDDKIFEVLQKYQILNIKNFCNECGNCSTFCPTNSAPYKEKPKFFLTISSFNEAEEGYYFARVKDKKNLIFRQKENIETLTEFSDAYLFETDFVLARFSKSDFKILDVKFKTPCVKEAQFRHAAEMSILIKGAENLVFG
jgi:putative selenate reductase